MDLLIRHYREQKKLTIAELSLRSGVNRNLISAIERGRYGRPNVGTLKKIADVLEVKLTDLFGRTKAVHD